MSKFIINVQAVVAAGSNAKTARKTVTAVKNSFEVVSLKIDSNIQSRNNIRKRIRTVSNDLSKIESKITAIHNFVDNSAGKYQQVDLNVKSMAPKKF